MRVGLHENRKTRQHRVAVFAALKVKVIAEITRQVRQCRQFRRQVAFVGARHAFVHFLQRHDVRLFVVDGLGSAQQVNFLSIPAPCWML